MKTILLSIFVIVSSLLYSQDMIGCTYQKIKYELSKKYEYTTGYSKFNGKYLQFYTPCESITYYFNELNICINYKILLKNDTDTCSNEN